MDSAALEVQSIDVERGGQSILKNFSLTVGRGAPFAIVGESGSGKTTLLHGVLGLLPLKSGTIKLNGAPVVDLPPLEMAKKAGLVFQDYQLFPHLSAMENLTLAPGLQGADAVEDRAAALLEELRIGQLQSRYPHELSGGQKQRVAIARALMLAPKILFFDEPSAALDIQTSRELSRTLKALETQVVVVSHDREFVLDCCEEGALLVDGRVDRQGPVKTLL